VGAHGISAFICVRLRLKFLNLLAFLLRPAVHDRDTAHAVEIADLPGGLQVVTP
jgi:hypothetical protein